MQTTQGMGKWSLAAAVAITALALALPTVASAGDEFEDGFKDELGRISAHEAVGVGRLILGHILHGGHSRHAYPRHDPPHRPTYHPRYRDRHHGYYDYGRPRYDRYVYHEHHHYRHKRKHYRRHHYKGHRGHGHRQHRHCDWDD